jgi:uncharacterized protein
MKLHADSAQAFSVQSHGPGWIAVGGERITHHVVLSSSGERRAWSCTGFDELNEHHFNQLLELNPELVIFGSGARLRFVHPSLCASLISHRIGMETMDTAAACRTYNILAQEGRKVVAALLIEPGANPSIGR